MQMQNWHLPIVCVPEGPEEGYAQTASQAGLCVPTRLVPIVDLEELLIKHPGLKMLITVTG